MENPVKQRLADFIQSEGLLTGEGDMLTGSGGVPFYGEMPVSAGRAGFPDGPERPTGTISIPGVTAELIDKNPYTVFRPKVGHCKPRNPLTAGELMLLRRAALPAALARVRDLLYTLCIYRPRLFRCRRRRRRQAGRKNKVKC